VGNFGASDILHGTSLTFRSREGAALHLPKIVLLPVKGEVMDEEAFHLACNLAKEAKGKVYALYIIEVERSLPLDADIAEEASRGEDILGRIEVLAKKGKCPLDADLLHCRQAGPAIIQEAVTKQADLIVLGVHKRNANGFHVGETTSYILHHATCPVLVWHNRVSGHPPSVRG
jgi:nucleotide-binding universal stress UspA family protein